MKYTLYFPNNFEIQMQMTSFLLQTFFLICMTFIFIIKIYRSNSIKIWRGSHLQLKK